MNTAALRIGRTLAFVLPFVLALSETLVVTRLSQAPPNTDSPIPAAPSGGASSSRPRATQDMLRERLLAELQEEDTRTRAVPNLQEGANLRPSPAKHCVSIARALGRAAARAYNGGRAYAFSRPVCDRSFTASAAQRID